MKSQLVPSVSPDGRTRYLVYLGRELYIDHSQENLDQKGVVTSHMDKTWKSFWAEGIACPKAQRSPWIPVCSTRSDCQDMNHTLLVLHKIRLATRRSGVSQTCLVTVCDSEEEGATAIILLSPAV